MWAFCLLFSGSVCGPIHFEGWPQQTVQSLVACVNRANGPCLTADAGVAVQVLPFEAVVLDASQSQGQGLSFLWEQIAGPPSLMEDETLVQANVTPQHQGYHLYQVTVRDGCQEAQAQVAVYVFSQSPPDTLGASLLVQAGSNPVQVQIPPIAGDDRLFVVEKAGLIRILSQGTFLNTPFLDMSGQVSGGFEQGLLGLAFDPDYQQNGRFFINFTNGAGDTVVQARQVSTDPDVADPTPLGTVLTVDQPFPNHNGGHLAFGPDGYLYIGLGDGGSANDPAGNGQNMNVLLGKMLRIEPLDAGYNIPGGNPFVGQVNVREEIWAYGLRNPWRYSFDLLTGDLLIADVGQNQWEEVDFQARDSAGGQNYGWKVKEGTHCFDPPSDCDPDPETFEDPIYEYSHQNGNCSITGGHVYRGSLIPELEGSYIFTDWCSGSFGLLRQEISGWEHYPVLIDVGGGSLSGNPVAIALDDQGELLICLASGQIYRVSGSL